PPVYEHTRRHVTVAHHQLAVALVAGVDQRLHHDTLALLPRRRPTRRHPQSRHEQGGSNGRTQQIVRPDAQAFDDLLATVLSGDDQHVRLDVQVRLAHAPTHLGPRHAWHDPVQDQYVGRLVRQDLFQRLLASLHAHHLVVGETVD